MVSSRRILSQSVRSFSRRLRALPLSSVVVRYETAGAGCWPLREYMVRNRPLLSEADRLVRFIVGLAGHVSSAADVTLVALASHLAPSRDPASSSVTAAAEIRQRDPRAPMRCARSRR